MFKFIVQDNQKFLVMRVSKRLYCSRCYPVLQMIAEAIVFAPFLKSCLQDNLSLVMAILYGIAMLYVVKLVAITMLFKHDLLSEMTGLNFFFPSKITWYRSLLLVLQDRFALYHITEVGGDAACYYKPIFCFWEKECYISKNHSTFSQALCQDKTNLTQR